MLKSNGKTTPTLDVYSTFVRLGLSECQAPLFSRLPHWHLVFWIQIGKVVWVSGALTSRYGDIQRARKLCH